MGWTAGWNMPGYLPESEPVEFETWSEAHSYIVGEVERSWDEGGDLEWLEAHTALHVMTPEHAYAITADEGRIVFWVSESEPLADDGPDPGFGSWEPDTLKEWRGEA